MRKLGPAERKKSSALAKLGVVGGPTGGWLRAVVLSAPHMKERWGELIKRTLEQPSLGLHRGIPIVRAAAVLDKTL